MRHAYAVGAALMLTVSLAGCSASVTDDQEAHACTRVSTGAHVFANALGNRDMAKDFGEESWYGTLEGIGGAIDAKDTPMSGELRAFADGMKREALNVVSALRNGDDDMSRKATKALDGINADFVDHCDAYWK
ncbi:hypothetical protein [Microbacterium sp. A94]|uniref:hypothetical protein n=1 Tax=Microbacterium sp. A94 TaxID=3450717 RepID=UPI003F41F02D